MVTWSLDDDRCCGGLLIARPLKPPVMARLLDGRLPPHDIVSTGSWRLSWLLVLLLSGELLPPEAYA